MDLEQGLLTRRSVRQFIKNKPIPDDIRDDIIKTAMYAPSAHNYQPWEFLVIDDVRKFPDVMNIHPYSAFLQDASMAIIVCGNLEEQYKENYWIVDCSAATENLLLGAHSKGLGACWCGIYPDQKRMEDFKKQFNLPEHIQPLALVIVGYPAAEPKQAHHRFKPEKIHLNQW